MNDEILSNEQCLQINQAFQSYERDGDETALNHILSIIMRNIIITLEGDDEEIFDKEFHLEKQFVIVLIEHELAQMEHSHDCMHWCCYRLRIQPVQYHNKKFSNYLINISRGRSLDSNRTGFLSIELIRQIFANQMSSEQLTEILQFVKKNRAQQIDYKDLATLLLITN